MTLTLTLKDRTERFLQFLTAAQAEPDPTRRWDLWVDQYRFLPFGDAPERRAETRQLFEVAWEQYPRFLPRIRRKGELSPERAEAILLKTCTLLGVKELQVELILGPGLMSQIHFSRAEGEKIFLFYPTDYPYPDPELVIAYLAALAICHVKIGQTTEIDDFDLAHQALLQGVAAHVLRQLLPKRSLADCLQASDRWVNLVAGQTAPILRDLQTALSLPPDRALLRAFFWESDYLEPERSGAWAGYLVVEELLQQYSLAAIAAVPPAGAPPLVRSALDSLLRHLEGD